MVNEKTKKGGISINREKVAKAIYKKIPESMSMDKLAEKIGVNRSTLYHLLNGEKASPDTLVKICLFTGVCLDELIMEKADVPKVKKKIIISCIDRLNGKEQETEIQALWDLMFPYIKRSFLAEIPKGGVKGIKDPFELLIILLREEDGDLRTELSDWIRKYAFREYWGYKKVIYSLFERMEELCTGGKKKRSA